MQRQAANTPFPEKSLLATIVILLLLGANVVTGLQLGMDHSLPGPRGRQTAYFAAALTSVVYGIGGYVYSDIVLDTLQKAGMGDAPDSTEAGLIAHFTDATALNAAISAAARLPRAAVAASPTNIIGQDDVGEIDFLAMSFKIFGVKYEALFDGYFLIIGLAAAIFILFPICTTETWFAILSIFFVSHLVLMETIPSLGYEFLTITNSRFFGALAILPLCYLLCAILSGIRFASASMVGVVLQSLLIGFVLVMRISSLWTILFLAAIILVLAVYSFVVRRLGSRRRGAAAAGEPRGKILPNLYLGGVVLVLVLAFWTGIGMLQRSNTSPKYASEGGVVRHLFWPSAFITLTTQPDLQAILSARYAGQSGDLLGFNAAIEKLREDGVPDSVWKPPPGAPLTINPVIYDETIKGLYLDLFRQHPLWVIESYLYYEPMLEINVLGDIWHGGLRRDVRSFIPLATMLGLAVVLFGARVRPRTIGGLAGLAAAMTGFSMLPSLIGGAAPWLLGEAALLSICVFYLVLMAILVAAIGLIAGHVLSPIGELAGSGRIGRMLGRLPANREQGSRRAFELVTLVLLCGFLWIPLDHSWQVSKAVAVAATASDRNYMITMPAACRNLPSLKAMLRETAPTDEALILGNGIMPASITASSFLEPRLAPEQLFNGNTGIFWHIDHPKSLPIEWLVIDLGAEKKAALGYIRMMTRIEAPDQFFKTACLIGSDDRKNWQGIAQLDVPRLETKNRTPWYGWNIPSSGSYRYYEVVIPNDIPSQFHTFYSIGKLEMYR